MEDFIANSEFRRLSNKSPPPLAAQPADNHHLGWCRSITSCPHWQSSHQPITILLAHHGETLATWSPYLIIFDLGVEGDWLAEKGRK
jgi:hypothetical protein